MLPLPHDGVCTACGLEGCSHLISRTPECLRCARLLLKRIHVFLSKERRRASPSPTAPFSFLFQPLESYLGCKARALQARPVQAPPPWPIVSMACVLDGDHDTASLHVLNCPHFVWTPLWLGETQSVFHNAAPQNQTQGVKTQTKDNGLQAPFETKFLLSSTFELPLIQYICTNYTVKQNQKENYLTFCGNFLFKFYIQAKYENIWGFFLEYMQL